MWKSENMQISLNLTHIYLNLHCDDVFCALLPQVKAIYCQM